jgi:hypothetical protein
MGYRGRVGGWRVTGVPFQPPPSEPGMRVSPHPALQCLAIQLRPSLRRAPLTLTACAAVVVHAGRLGGTRGREPGSCESVVPSQRPMPASAGGQGAEDPSGLDDSVGSDEQYACDNRLLVNAQTATPRMNDIHGRSLRRLRPGRSAKKTQFYPACSSLTDGDTHNHWTPPR